MSIYVCIDTQISRSMCAYDVSFGRGAQSTYVNPQIDTNSIQKRGLPIWEYSTLPAHFRTGTPHMEMGSVFLATSKSRIEEYLPPNFGQEIVIFPLSRITPWKSPFPYGDPRFHIGS